MELKDGLASLELGRGGIWDIGLTLVFERFVSNMVGIGLQVEVSRLELVGGIGGRSKALLGKADGG